TRTPAGPGRVPARLPAGPGRAAGPGRPGGPRRPLRPLLGRRRLGRRRRVLRPERLPHHRAAAGGVAAPRRRQASALPPAPGPAPAAGAGGLPGRLLALLPDVPAPLAGGADPAGRRQRPGLLRQLARLPPPRRPRPADAHLVAVGRGAILLSLAAGAGGP